MGILYNFATSPSNPLNLLSAAFSHPIKFIENPLSASKQTLQEGNVKTITNVVTNTAIASAGLLTAGAVFAPTTTVGAVGSTLLKTAAANPKTSIVTAISIPIVTGIVTANPKGTIKAISSTPSSLSNVGANVGNLISNPSLDNLTKVYKENPVTSSIITGAAALTVGSGVGAIVSTVLNTKAVKENTNAMITPTTPNTTLPVTTQNGDISKSVLPTNPLLPQLPATQPLAAARNGGGGKYAKRKKVSLTSVNQRVSVIVQQKNNNSYNSKRYLNREVLIH